MKEKEFITAGVGVGQPLKLEKVYAVLPDDICEGVDTSQMLESTEPNPDFFRSLIIHNTYNVPHIYAALYPEKTYKSAEQYLAECGLCSNDDYLREYELIKNKRSKLSRGNRDRVDRIVRTIEIE